MPALVPDLFGLQPSCAAAVKRIAPIALSSDAPDVIVFETDNHDDIRKMISFWRDTTEFRVFPGVDLGSDFRKQGMKVS